MKLFIDQTTVIIKEYSRILNSNGFEKQDSTSEEFNNKKEVIVVSDLKEEVRSFQGDIAIDQVIAQDALIIISYFRNGLFKNVDRLTLFTNEKEQFIETFKAQFNIVKAAGGVVEKKDNVLFIKRFGLWDLPKGKKEKGESMKVTAIREVEEECNIEVELVKKLCTTWHTYFRNDKFNLKKTNWYIMNLINDDHMAPQIEEGIESTEWINQNDLTSTYDNTYKSIIYILKKYEKYKASMEI